MPITFILSIWGAGLSTILAIVKIWDIYRDRKNIHATCLLTADPIRGDRISIYNPSKSAVMIEHWKLLWVTKKSFLGKKIVPIDIFDDENCHLNLAAKSIQALNFNGQYHFNWRPEIEKNIKLFIKLRIAGRKGYLTKLVYPTNLLIVD